MSKKLTLPSLSDPATKQALQKIVDAINELQQGTNQHAQAQPSDTEGKKGDIRVVKGADGKHYVEVRTDEGWARSSEDTFTLQPKETK